MECKKRLDKYKPSAHITIMAPEDLKNWRRVNGYTQDKLAEALSVHILTVSRWERGVREIPPFLHLALRCLGLEGGELRHCRTKNKSERRKKHEGQHSEKR